MERRKKITIILILMFVHVFVGIHVYFCPERSIIFGRVKTIANMVTEIKRNPNEHKKIPRFQKLSPFISIYYYYDLEKRKSQYLYKKSRNL